MQLLALSLRNDLGRDSKRSTRLVARRRDKRKRGARQFVALRNQAGRHLISARPFLTDIRPL